MSANPPQDPNKSMTPTSQTSQGSGGALGAGKSLALMQQRYQMARPSDPPTQTAPLAAPNQLPRGSVQVAGPLAPAPSASLGQQRPGKSAAQLMATQAAQQSSAPAPTQAPPTIAVPQGGRPKGKDFATMAITAKSKPPAQAPPPAALPTQSPRGGMTSPSAGRPKGKDFSAMASRMAPAPAAAHAMPSQQPQQQPQQQQQQQAQQMSAAAAQRAARAREMQAQARAAAGYTVPTAGAPPPPQLNTIAPPAPTRQARPTAAPALVSATDPRQQQHLSRMQQKKGETPILAQNASQRSRSSGGGGGGSASRRSGSTSSRSKGGGSSSSSSKLASTAKATIQPSSSEGRLAMSGAAHVAPLVGQRLKDIVTSLDPNYVLDADAEIQVLQLADEFLEKVTKQSMRLAQHRGSKNIDVQDIHLCLAKQWGITVPGLGALSLKPSKAGNRVGASGSGTSNKKRASATASAGGSGEWTTGKSSKVAKTGEKS